nr:low-affinity inorganic phosphate transporter PitA [Mycolicibacter nonchromogenicus]
MAAAWLVTLPMAGGGGSGAYGLVHGIGGYPGIIIGVVLLITAVLAIWLRSRRARSDHNNVNAEWQGTLTGGLEAPGVQPEEVGREVENALRAAFETGPAPVRLTVVSVDDAPAREVVGA